MKRCDGCEVELEDAEVHTSHVPDCGFDETGQCACDTTFCFACCPTCRAA